MSFTFWMHDKKIGESRMEVPSRRRRLAGTFEPTDYGLAVLPDVTSVIPALLAFGKLCQRLGMDLDDTRPSTASAALDELGETPEARALANATRHIAQIVVRDAAGAVVRWQSLVISDLRDLTSLPRKTRRDDFVIAPRSHPPIASPDHEDPPRYFVSLTLARSDFSDLPRPQHLRPERRQSSTN